MRTNGQRRKPGGGSGHPAGNAGRWFAFCGDDAPAAFLPCWR